MDKTAYVNRSMNGFIFASIPIHHKETFIMRKHIALIALAIIILVSGSATAGTSTTTSLFYHEDFSGYAVGAFPSGWAIVASGAGNSEQRIADIGGNKVLLAQSQSGQSAVLRHSFGSLPEKINFSFQASLPTGASVWIGNGTKQAVVGSAADDQWVLYTLEIDFSKGMFDLYINGSLTASDTLLTAQDASSPLSSNPGIAMDTGHASGNDTAMIDNINVIEVIETQYSYYPHNTVCTFGPHFRDVSPELTDKWYMFTPVDLSQDGMQTHILVGGGAYIIGYLNIYVSGDSVTVYYQYFNDGIQAEQEFFTFFHDYASITTVTPEEIDPLFSYGTPISIANDLNGDTTLILFARNVVTFRNDNPLIIRFWENTPDFKAQREQMLTLLDGQQGY